MVVSTHLKNISQIGNLPQVGMKIKNIWNHHLVSIWHLTFYPSNIPNYQNLGFQCFEHGEPPSDNGLEDLFIKKCVIQKVNPSILWLLSSPARKPIPNQGTRIRNIPPLGFRKLIFLSLPFGWDILVPRRVYFTFQGGFLPPLCAPTSLRSPKSLNNQPQGLHLEPPNAHQLKNWMDLWWNFQPFSLCKDLVFKPSNW